MLDVAVKVEWPDGLTAPKLLKSLTEEQNKTDKTRWIIPILSHLAITGFSKPCATCRAFLPLYSAHARRTWGRLDFFYSFLLHLSRRIVCRPSQWFFCSESPYTLHQVFVL